MSDQRTGRRPVTVRVARWSAVHPWRAIALWLAFGVGVATLTAQGVRYARLEHMSRVGALLTVAVNLVFGLALVVLKTVVH